MPWDPDEPKDPHVITTFTGRLVNPWDLTPDDIDIRDIAHALARINRFNGHTRGVLNVADHSIRASRRVPPEYALEALLHDASEAYLGDVPSPLKRQPGMAEFRRAEARAHAAVAVAFGLVGYPRYTVGLHTPNGARLDAFHWPPAVEDADLAEYQDDRDERRNARGHRAHEPASEQAFLLRYDYLRENRP